MADRKDSRAAPQAPALAPGDEVIICARVVRVEPGGALVVAVGPVEAPGHEGGYVQTVTLQHAELAARI